MFRRIATHCKRTTENHVKRFYCGTHKAPETEQGQGTAGGEAHKQKL
jgi:hypothetical protein